MYISFSKYLKAKYGTRVRRLSLDAGFKCPNRSGDPPSEGCVFCNEEGFTGAENSGALLEEQIARAIEETGRKWGPCKYIAYFQNASNTNAGIDELKRAYDTIKKFSGIVGLFISTRPDCVDAAKLDLIAGYAKDYEVWIEYGVQTAHDRSLKFLDRGHTFRQSVEAIKETAKRGIKVGAHIILGIPGESEEDMLHTADCIAKLPVSGVKLHVLHVLKGTRLEEFYRRGEITLLEKDEYVDIVFKFLGRLTPDCIILRLVSDARREFLVAPGWMNNKQDVIREIERRCARVF